MIDFKLLSKYLAESFPLQYRPRQMTGIIKIITAFYQNGYSDIQWLSYILATAFHETGFTMLPVTEYGSEKYLKEKPYWPYIGRGYVQITWLENYKKYGIDKNPEMALDADIAAFILIDGMVNGSFTSRKLSNYFNYDAEDPIGARKIINGNDRSMRVAEYYNGFKSALIKTMES